MKRFLIFFVILLFQTGVMRAEGEVENSSSSPLLMSGTSLPLKIVVLFSSGVGYFERDGYVEGDKTLELRFTKEQINDVLKSMVVMDLDGGTVGGIEYPSKEPLGKLLGEFPIDFEKEHALFKVLDRLRGENVRVLMANEEVIGGIVGVEREDTGGGRGEVYYLTLLTNEGFKRISFSRIKSISFLNGGLDARMREELSLIAGNRNWGDRVLRLKFVGKGRRRIRIAYLLESPVWKTTYRLIVDGRGKGTSFIQGWAIVDNVSGDDWNRVKLTLVTGQPLSFVMDLYSSIYVRRPRVRLNTGGGVFPEIYESGIEEGEREMGVKRAIPPSASPRRESASKEFLSMDLTRGVETAIKTRNLGEFFHYTPSLPVSILSHHSAMIPIINRQIKTEQVCLYNQEVLKEHPLSGVKILNDTGFYLNGGPVTVFENGSYAGDAVLSSLRAGEDGFITYAVDTGTDVILRTEVSGRRVYSAKILNGNVITREIERRVTTYRILNRDSRGKRLVIEKKIDPYWRLVEPEKPYEVTESYNRFVVNLPPWQGNKRGIAFRVVEEHVLRERISLNTITSPTINLILSSSEVPSEVKEAFKRLSAIKLDISRLKESLGNLKEKYNSILKDQKRIRENMKVLEKKSALYERYLRRLSSEEDEITRILSTRDKISVQLEKKKRELVNFIFSLRIE